MTNGCFVRNSVIGPSNLATPTPNVRFHGSVAAYLPGRSPRLARRISEGRNFDTSASGSKRTDALQHGRPISWRSECPLPGKATSTLATVADVRNPPFVTIVARCLDRPFAGHNDPAQPTDRLTPEEPALHDALAENRSAVDRIGARSFRPSVIAIELDQTARRNSKVDWRREDVRSRVPVAVKKIRRRHGFPRTSRPKPSRS